MLGRPDFESSVLLEVVEWFAVLLDCGEGVVAMGVEIIWVKLGWRYADFPHLSKPK
jgi:hypothetical protein